MAIGRRHGDQIHVHVLKTFSWDSKIGYWRHSVLLHLGTLAWETFAGPFAYILSKVGPDKLVGNRLPRPLDSRMPEFMHHVKDSSAVRERDKGSGWTVGNIHVQENRTNLDFSEAQTSLCISHEGSEFRIECLLAGHVLQVN